jgi:hypothetical protein
MNQNIKASLKIGNRSYPSSDFYPSHLQIFLFSIMLNILSFQVGLILFISSLVSGTFVMINELNASRQFNTQPSVPLPEEGL